MADAIIQIEQLLKEKNFTKAEAAVSDALKLEEWVNNYGTELTLSKAYCLLFSNQSKLIDTIAVRAILGTLTEEKINDASEFYQQVAMEIDAELDRLEQSLQPDEREAELRATLEVNGKPNLESMYLLAEHLKNKNRHQESVDLLLDLLALDRNWNDRKAQKLLTDLFKALGSNSEITKNGRKIMSKLLF